MLLFESHSEIRTTCAKYGIRYYTINSDGSIDVNGNVNISGFHLKKLPIKFNIVAGDFTCAYNNLRDLEGCPKIVDGFFYCYSNNLRSLKGCPGSVGRNFDAAYNLLLSLEYMPANIGGNIKLSENRLTSLKGCPETVNGHLEVDNNNLTNLEGCAKYIKGSLICPKNNIIDVQGAPIEIEGDTMYCSSNPINEIYGFYRSYSKFIKSINDYNYIRGNKIIKDRFEEALNEMNIVAPEKLFYYLYI